MGEGEGSLQVWGFKPALVVGCGKEEGSHLDVLLRLRGHSWGIEGSGGEAGILDLGGESSGLGPEKLEGRMCFHPCSVTKTRAPRWQRAAAG